jgi:glutathione peroxidase
MNSVTTFVIIIVYFSYIVSGGTEDDNFYSLTATNIDGEEVALDAFKGKVSLVVNVASKCGFTTISYKELVQMYRDLGAEDYFTILAFPCNQFGEQEPEKEDVIHKFVTEQFDVKFPMFSRVDVTGENAHPVWKYLVKATGSTPTWNFFKYLVDHTGRVVEVFATKESLWKYDPEGAYDLIKMYVKEAKKYAKESKPKVVKKELREDL